MTFEERCERFRKNTEKETNIFKYIYRIIFLNKKIEQYNKEEFLFGNYNIPYERPKDHPKAKQIINKEQ